MFKEKSVVGFILAAVVIVSGFISVIAAEDWKSSYRDVSQIEGTEYYLIHLYDVQTDDGAGYACGVADKNGNVVLPVKYGVIDTEDFSDQRRLIITFGGKHGFVDENFNVVIEPVFDRAWPFENGAAKVQKKNADETSRIFYIDPTGNEIPDPTPEAEKDFEYYRERTGQELDLYIYGRLGGSDYAVCQKGGGKFGVINVKTKEYLTPLKWENISVDESGQAWAQTLGESGAYPYRTSVIKLDGSEEYKFDSEYITSVAGNGFIFVMKYAAVKQPPYDNQGTELEDASIPCFGLMDAGGQVIIEPVWEVPSGWYDEMPGYSDGYLIGQQNSKNYQLIRGIGTVGDGKFGCVKKTGAVVLEPVYDSIVYEGNNKFTVTAGGETKTIALNAGASASGTNAASAKAAANPTSSVVYVNGAKVDFEAYLIDGYNYFKLRDIAFALNGTEKQFDVGFDSAANAITLTSGRSYTVTGGELQKGGGEPKEALPTTSEVYLDGVKAELSAYNIGGYNYFKLRDLGNLLGFAIDYDAADKRVSISTVD